MKRCFRYRIVPILIIIINLCISVAAYAASQSFVLQTAALSYTDVFSLQRSAAALRANERAAEDDAQSGENKEQVSEETSVVEAENAEKNAALLSDQNHALIIYTAGGMVIVALCVLVIILAVCIVKKHKTEPITAEITEVHIENASISTDAIQIKENNDNIPGSAPDVSIRERENLTKTYGHRGRPIPDIGSRLERNHRRYKIRAKRNGRGKS